MPSASDRITGLRPPAQTLVETTVARRSPMGAMAAGCVGAVVARAGEAAGADAGNVDAGATEARATGASDGAGWATSSDVRLAAIVSAVVP